MPIFFPSRELQPSMSSPPAPSCILSQNYTCTSLFPLVRTCILRKQRAPCHVRCPPRSLSSARRRRRSIQAIKLQGDPLPSSSLTELANAFYSSVNQKNLVKLKKLVSQDCIFTDMTCMKPLQEKMIHQFYEKLMESMGEHVRFVIDEISEGSSLTITVIWHLEWKNMQIPFTKGCSFFMCSRDGEVLRIKEARVFVESPVKLGSLSLDMLKIVVSLFDKFPFLAENFLKKSDAIAQFVIKLYKMLVEPFVVPLFLCYSRTWTYLLQMIYYAFSILHGIMKLFKWM